jgi:hypothetical protein
VLSLPETQTQLTPSSSGKAYTTPAGHTPKWVDRVSWHRASAFEPDSYADLVSGSSAVVHTLGILLEDTGYKRAVRDGDIFGVARALVNGVKGDGNPMKTTQERRAGYDGMNRDSGECKCRRAVQACSGTSH